MRTPRFNELPKDDQDRIDTYLDGTIEPAEFEALQNRMLADPALRAVMRRYLALDDSLRSRADAVGENRSSGATAPWLEAADATPVSAPGKVVRLPKLVPLALAASLVTLLSLGILFLNSRSGNSPDVAGNTPEAQEPVANGFAVVGRLFDAKWPSADAVRREGDTLGGEVFRLAAGTAEIQFFSGAAMTVEGPAEIMVRSAWEAACREGAVRVRVPPAARGFKLHAPSTEIVDLGTEFGLSVRGGREQVEVFDGEIALRPGGADEMVLQKGGALDLAANRAPQPATAGSIIFPSADQLGTRAAQQRSSDFDRWAAHRDASAGDARLLLYYTFDNASGAGLIPNLKLPRNPELDGAVVLAEPVAGRWPGLKSALEFRRPGARVRVNVPGEFSAFTFACWVRIDSLDRLYNALFMADGYENGEPHWQIRNDGRMMLSVMVDDSRSLPGHPESRFHHVYLSPPMWDISMSGQWLHLASVFDPASRQVSHYVNGERLSREDMASEFFVGRLRIGNGEVGNWGQPLRKDPSFTIRNLNGRMDELAIFDAALADEEIAKLFTASRTDRR